MATEILAIGVTAASSSDVTIAAGDTLTVSLKTTTGSPVPATARVEIELKDDNNVYHSRGALDASRPAVVIVAGGVYRFTRAPGASCGVFSG